MKIFYFCNIDLGEKGAQAVHIKEIIDNLHSYGHSINLFAPKRNKPIKMKVPVHALPTIKKHHESSYNVVLFFSFLYYLIKSRPDIAYIRNSPFLISPVLISRLFRVPYVLEVNGKIEKQLKIENVHPLLIKINNFLENWVCNNSSKIITTSDSLKNYLAKTYQVDTSKMESLESGVNTKLFKPKSQSKMKKELGLNSKNVYVGYVGGLLKWQGVDYLIKSSKKVVREIPNCKFIIIGEGPEKENLQKLIDKEKLGANITLMGPVEYDKVPDYINSFDICICYLTRINEGNYGVPFKVYEYLSCRKPVILSDIKGIAPLFKDRVVIAKPEDPKDLAKQIIKLLKNSKEREELSKIARAFVLKGHSWRDVAKRTDYLIRDLINKQ